MRMFLMVLAVVLLGSASAYSASESELRIGGTYLSPSGDFWKSGGGANIQWRYSVQKDFALAVSLGIQKLDVSTDEVSDGPVNTLDAYGLLYRGYVDNYEGDATLVPVGASAIYNIPLGQNVLSLEAGLKYVFVNSRAKANMIDGVVDSRGNVVSGSVEKWQEDVEIGNNLLGSIGAQIDIPLNQQVKLYIGGGYQFDIVKGDVELKSDWADYDGIKTTENELGSVFAEAGIAYKF